MGMPLVVESAHSAPVSASTAKQVTESERRLATKSREPSRVRQKFRGVLPNVAACAVGEGKPRASSAKIAMLSWPRFEAYTTRPEGATCTSEPVLPACATAPGKVEHVTSGVKPESPTA